MKVGSRPSAPAAPAFAAAAMHAADGFVASMLLGVREAAFLSCMMIAGIAIADPGDSRASASLWRR